MDYETKASKRVAHMILSRLGRGDQRVMEQADGSVMFLLGQSDVRVGVNRVNDWAHVDLSVAYWDVNPRTDEETEIGNKHCFYSIDGYGRDDWAQIAEIADLL